MASDVAAVFQGLECSLCLNLLEEPKLLSCTHSFCEKCLHHLHHSQGTKQELKCPLCRKVTRLGSEGLSSLKTNVPLKSLVGDVKTRRMFCTLCDPEVKSLALHYCQQCDEYMCEACLQVHGQFRKNASHTVVSMADIKSGKAKVSQMCHEHAGEEKLWVCTSCKASICFKCRMLDHDGDDHVVQKVENYRTAMHDEIAVLQKEGLKKMTKIKSYAKIIKDQIAKVDAIIAEREDDINQAYDETLLQLNAKKKTLLDQCKEKKRKLTEELNNRYGKKGDDLITSLNSVCELIGNGVRALLEGEALDVHNNLCRELQDMLDRDDPDESEPKQVACQAEAVTFTPYRLDDEHNLGMLNMNEFVLQHVVTCTTSGIKPAIMAPTKTGRILVGYWKGYIEEFTVDGSQATVFEDKTASRVSVLSDGRYVVRDFDEKISLYSSDWKKLHTEEFKMKLSKPNDYGGMDVDKHDNIYVGFCVNETIQVFTPEGGEPIRKIPCSVHRPYLVCTLNHSNMLLVCDQSTVGVIDGQGTVKYDFTKKDFSARPVVLMDDSILIAWKKDGPVTIDLYTSQLRYVRTVISDMECRSGYWHDWALGEFSSGEIALCGESKFYVLEKS